MTYRAVWLAATGLALASTPVIADVFERSADGALARVHAQADVFAENAPPSAKSPDQPKPPAANRFDPYQDLFAAAAERYAISPALLHAVAWQESREQQAAVSPAGAVGVMQLMPATAAELGVDPRNAEQNIFGGAAYLRRQLDRFDGRLDLALAAYNAGAAAVSSAGAVPAIPETRTYVTQILERLSLDTPR